MNTPGAQADRRSEYLLALYYGYAAAVAIADAPPTPDHLDVLSSALVILDDSTAQPLAMWSPVEHTRWFIPSTSEPLAPLFEGFYREGQRNALLEELLRFYHHFELKLRTTGGGQLPDELPLQLECLQFLAWRELAALTEKVDYEAANAYTRARREFIVRHMGYLDFVIARLDSLPDALHAATAFRAIMSLTEADKQLGTGIAGK